VTSLRYGEALASLDRMRANTRHLDNQNDVISVYDAGEMLREDYLMTANFPGMRGITTGWDYLDELTSGISPGDVWAVVARPGVGKSYTMLKMALAAWQAGHSVAFVTMEMTVLQNARRMFAMEAGINPTHVRRGELDMHGEEMLFAALDSVTGRPPFYFMAGDLKKTVADIDNMVQEYSPDIIFIDAAYLLDPERPGRLSRHEHLQDILKNIKSLAMGRDRAVVISVQFNRQGTNTGGLDHISGTDYIGQIASVVLSITPGPRSHPTTMRTYKIIKNRDDIGGREFATNYLFSPFNMDFRYELEDGRPINRYSQLLAGIQVG
jgi:replicative DNA helicase